jgi:hypothetical protein
MRISQRVQGFTESVIREMTRVVAQCGGVNLAQGMPNFRPPQALIDAAHRAIDGDFHQYAITWGAPSLRGAIAEKYRRRYEGIFHPLWTPSMIFMVRWYAGDHFRLFDSGDVAGRNHLARCVPVVPEAPRSRFAPLPAGILPAVIQSVPPAS